MGWTNFKIPQHHEELLRTMLSLSVDVPIPNEVRKCYYEMLVLHNRIGEGMPTTSLAVAVILSKKFKDDKFGGYLSKWEHVDKFTPVQVQVGEKKSTGKFYGMNSGKVSVISDDDSTVKNYKPEQVEVLEPLPA